MIAPVYVACDGKWDEPEVQISGSAEALASFGAMLNEVTEALTLDVPVLENEFYPASVKILRVEPDESGDGRVTVSINEFSLTLRGARRSLNKIGDSLVNFFDKESTVGEHFHLDYYESNDLLNETNCHIIFVCDR